MDSTDAKREVEDDSLEGFEFLAIQDESEEQRESESFVKGKCNKSSSGRFNSDEEDELRKRTGNGGRRLSLEHLLEHNKLTELRKGAGCIN